jgi:transcriptional regulator with PAS, ATPase and Fis domain
MNKLVEDVVSEEEWTSINKKKKNNKFLNQLKIDTTTINIQNRFLNLEDIDDEKNEDERSEYEYESEDDNEKEKAESLNVWQDIKYELLTNSSSVIKSLERKILCKNGSIKHFEVAITFDNSTIYALFYDITERKIAENKLKKSEAQFRNLAEQMLLPVCFIDFDGKFLFLNKSFTQKFGYTLKDFPDIRTVVNNTKASKEVKKQGVFSWQNEVKGLFENKKKYLKEEQGIEGCGIYNFLSRDKQSITACPATAI